MCKNICFSLTTLCCTWSHQLWMSRSFLMLLWVLETQYQPWGNKQLRYKIAQPAMLLILMINFALDLDGPNLIYFKIHTGLLSTEYKQNENVIDFSVRFLTVNATSCPKIEWEDNQQSATEILCQTSNGPRGSVFS